MAFKDRQQLEEKKNIKKCQNLNSKQHQNNGSWMPGVQQQGAMIIASAMQRVLIHKQMGKM